MSDLATIIEDLAGFANDPFGFVMYSFPWGEPGTDLESETGPDEWQEWALRAIGIGLLTPDEAVRIAVASGHGIGKSVLVSWIILWAAATFEDTRGVVTANTEKQLSTKTRAELAKWHRLFIGKEMFHLTATALYSADPAHEMTWRIDLIPWSENNPEAFAGLHNKGKRVIVLFDEASTIADVIWETTEGAMTDTDTQLIWAVFGNPTKNTGRFRECFSKFKARWLTRQVDSRSTKFANHKLHQEWIDDYGEDSDFVRVRVRGIFPRAGSMEFIALDSATEAARREVSVHLHDPLVLGVDVARFGEDASVIYIRKGRDGRTTPPIILRGVDTMTLAGKVAETAMRLRADAIFVDGGGVGGGVVDRLRQLRVQCFDVQFGAKPDGCWAQDNSGEKYANKRAELWGTLRAWLKTGAIWDNQSLIDELISPTYGFNADNAIQLERKEDMRRRGAASPDIADALALTFAFPVMASAAAGREGHEHGEPLVKSEYDPFDLKTMAA